MNQRAFMSGFTLIELLVYVGILTIVLGIIFFFIANIIINERSIGDRVRTMDEADFAMRQILDQTRGAKNIDISTNFSAGQLVLAKTNSTVNFSVSSSTLVMTDNSTGAVVTRTLTSPNVVVDTFTLVCVGDPASSCKISPTENPKGVRITLGLHDVATNQPMTITTSATPRGY